MGKWFIIMTDRDIQLMPIKADEIWFLSADSGNKIDNNEPVNCLAVVILASDSAISIHAMQDPDSYDPFSKEYNISICMGRVDGVRYLRDKVVDNAGIIGEIEWKKKDCCLVGILEVLPVDFRSSQSGIEKMLIIKQDMGIIQLSYGRVP